MDTLSAAGAINRQTGADGRQTSAEMALGVQALAAAFRTPGAPDDPSYVQQAVIVAARLERAGWRIIRDGDW